MGLRLWWGALKNSFVKTRSLACIALLLSLFTVFCSERTPPQKGISLEGFSSIFDGETLTGWRKLTESSESSGIWEVVDGTIVASQTPEGKWGLLVTLKRYSDFEVYAEVKADYPIDTGIFLRVQPHVLSYQVTIDYRPEGEVGAIYCPGGGDFLVHNPGGKDLWRNDAFNTVQARIQGQPPRIQAWINDTKVVDFSDTSVENGYRVPREGFFGIQVHGGSSWGKGNKVYFRRLLIKELNSH
ncbi:MAG: DUF1080 domain-containing protein [Candidatus Aminicenantes bacterium]|nr:DUF1080 domain-containing protein [Candidatus Aminicenantes bacterium]